MSIRSQIQRRVDSWYNALTGLGNALRDKRESTYFTYDSKIADQTLEDLYHDDDISARICEALPEEALRNGYYLSSEDDDPGLASQLHEYEKKLKFPKALKDCAVWSRVFGGAVIYLGIDDGQEEDQPVNEAAIKAITFAEVLDKRSLIPAQRYTTLERFGQPEIYEIQWVATMNAVTPQDLQPGAKIHESRILRMDGTRTSPIRAERDNGWHDSVLQKVYETVRDFGSSWQAIGHLLQDASQGKFKIKNLAEMIASGDKDALSSRMQLVDMSRSVARAIMLDAENEEFTRDTYSFAGIPDVMKMYMIRLAAAARMPVIVLMGQSPQGLNATGEADIRLWYDKVKIYQEDHLLDVITRFYELVFLAQDFAGSAPEAWEVKFGKLWQMSDEEQAEFEKKTAEKDKIYIDAGVLLPEEVALNRFKAKGFSSDTQIDMEAREEMLQAEIDLAKEKAGEEPIPPPIPGQALEPPKSPGPADDDE